MKKIAILGLHLGYGGVEQAIVNQANMLCDTYEVELVIFYKLLEKPAFKIDPKVKVIYLTSLKPNKKEFLEYLKNKRYFKAFKEGLKSLKILYYKKKKIKDYLKNTTADIVISSRIEFSEILNKINSGYLKIAEEHVYHNNNQKYITRLGKAIKNIDYLVLVSKELTEFYQKKYSNNKCVYIPNSLNFWPANMVKLNNKNLISVGRLSPEKGFLDLVLVIKKVTKLDQNIHLNIIGDGDELLKIKDLIKEHKLENNITLHGFQNQEYIAKIMEKSSLYVMTSYEESFGIVLIEAGAFGIPAVAFDSAEGAKEIINNNKSGYLIKDRNQDEMAKKIVYLLNNLDLLKNMGQESRNIAHNYSFQEVKNIWLNFLNKL